MKKFYLAILAGALLFAPACEKNVDDIVEPEEEKTGVFAFLDISAGGEPLEQVVIELYPDKAPETVDNFTGLATGEKKYLDPQTQEWTTGRFYDGLTFHRVIEDFMIQGGDPLGTGTGGPGYRFDCEISEDLSFDQPGVVAMANAGPDTNGSQFFITVAPAPWLDGKHTIFGQVVKGMESVMKISRMPTEARAKPAEPVVIEAVEIEQY
ncbi:MAG: peptidylprolyl isomerase [Elusimicrobiota bacterium]